MCGRLEKTDFLLNDNVSKFIDWLSCFENLNIISKRGIQSSKYEICNIVAHIFILCIPPLLCVASSRSTIGDDSLPRYWTWSSNPFTTGNLSLKMKPNYCAQYKVENIRNMYIMRNAKILPECHLQCSKLCSSLVLHSSRRFSPSGVPADRSNLRNQFRNRIPLINAHYNCDSH